MPRGGKRTGAGRPRVGELVVTRIPDETIRLLTDYARRRDMTRAAALRDLIIWSLDEWWLESP